MRFTCWFRCVYYNRPLQVSIFSLLYLNCRSCLGRIGRCRSAIICVFAFDLRDCSRCSFVSCILFVVVGNGSNNISSVGTNGTKTFVFTTFMIAKVQSVNPHRRQNFGQVHCLDWTNWFDRVHNQVRGWTKFKRIRFRSEIAIQLILGTAQSHLLRPYRKINIDFESINITSRHIECVHFSMRIDTFSIIETTFIYCFSQQDDVLIHSSCHRQNNRINPHQRVDRPRCMGLLFSRAGPLFFPRIFFRKRQRDCAEGGCGFDVVYEPTGYRMWVKMRYTRDCVHVMLVVVGQADRGVEWLADPEDRSSENSYLLFEKRKSIVPIVHKLKFAARTDCDDFNSMYYLCFDECCNLNALNACRAFVKKRCD